MRLDISFVRPLVNHIESPTVVLVYDGFPSLDYRLFHGRFPCASPSNYSLLYTAERLIREERR